jgi:nucleoid DNA-binding protein
MTKAALINAIQKDIKLSKDECEKFIDSFMGQIKKTLKDEDYVNLPRFGKLEIRSHGAIKGRNPKTGEEITIKPFRAVRLKPSKFLVQYLTD